MGEKTENMLPDIQRTIIMDAPIEKVWKAIATSEGLAAWLMPNNFQPELGYEFTFEARGDYSGLVPCKVMELDPPHKLGITWSDWYVSFELTELEPEKTQLTLVHSGWTLDQAIVREKMYEGWGYLTEGLREKLGDKNGGYFC